MFSKRCVYEFDNYYILRYYLLLRKNTTKINYQSGQIIASAQCPNVTIS